MISSSGCALRYTDMLYQLLDVLWRCCSYTGYQEGYAEVHDGTDCAEGIG